MRGKLEWEPNDRLLVTATADYYRRDADCCVWTSAEVGPVPGAPEAAAAAVGIVAGPGNFKQNLNGDVFAKSRSYGTSVQVDYELGEFTLTSISAYRRWFTKDGLDSDSSPANLLDINFGILKQSQVSQELRITSPTGGFLDYVAGVYFFKSGVHSASTQIFPAVPLPFFYRLAVIDAETRNIAAFGQANFNISEDLRLIAGARVLNEKVDADKYRQDARMGLSDSATAGKDDDAFVWRLGAQYDVNDDIMAFATVTRGYKGGGYDTNIGVGGRRDVRREKPTTYELGLRTSWPAIRLTANATAFWSKVKDYQSAGRDPLTATYPIANGEAKTRGVEFGVMWRPLADADLAVLAGAAYVDSEWGSFANAPCFGGQTLAEGCIGGVQQDLTGARLPFSPMWQGNVAVRYATEVATDWRLTLDANASYRSKMLIAFPNNPRTEQEGYMLVDASIGVGPSSRRWKASCSRRICSTRTTGRPCSPRLSATRAASASIRSTRVRVVGVGLDFDF